MSKTDEEENSKKLYESIKEFLLIRQGFDWWVLLGRISVLAGILGFVLVIAPAISKSYEAIVGVFFIGVCATFFLIDNILQRRKIYQNEKEREKLQKLANYSDAIPILNNGFAKIHDLIRKNNGNFEASSREEKYNAFVHLCTTLSSTFLKITGKKCSVCIKVFEQGSEPTTVDDKLLKMSTLCRDSESNNKTRNFSKPVEHYVAWNTDFFQIFKSIGTPDGEIFFHNKLPLLNDYWNTSFPVYDENLTYKGPSKSLSENDRIKYWRLPYKSTMVVPICPHSGSVAVLEDVIGFLCVDSFDMEAFDKDNNYNILTGVADGISYPLFCWMKMGFK